MRKKTNLTFKEEALAGWISCGAFAIELLILVSTLCYSVFKHGQAGLMLGIGCALCAVIAIIGCGGGIIGINQRKKQHKFSIVGLILNIIILVIIIVLYVVGILVLI